GDRDLPGIRPRRSRPSRGAAGRLHPRRQPADGTGGERAVALTGRPEPGRIVADLRTGPACATIATVPTRHDHDERVWHMGRFLAISVLVVLLVIAAAAASIGSWAWWVVVGVL